MSIKHIESIFFSADYNTRRMNGMRISTQTVIDNSSRNIPRNVSVDKVEKSNEAVIDKEYQLKDQVEYSKEKLSQAVDSLNEFLDISYKSSKFILHEGLDRYYIQLVDKETEEVIKEIPPKKLLDAFYEMQKLVGMIVDEKI